MKTFTGATSGNRRVNFFPANLGFSLMIALFDSAIVQAAPPSITQINPINTPQAQTAAPQSSAPADVDERNAKLAEKLSQLLNHDAGGTNVLTQLSPRQRKAASNLMQQSGSDLRLRVRTGVGTVRYLKVADAGKKLKRAATKMAPGSDNAKLTAQEFLEENRELLNIAEPSEEFVLVRHLNDKLGHSHLRYQQKYKNIPVWPSDAAVHLDPQGDVELFEGAYIPTPSRIVLDPEVTPEDAQAKARNAVPGAESAEFSEPELVLYALDDKPVRLAWKMDVNLSMSARWLVAVDAIDGSVLTAFNQVMDANIKGSGTDLMGVKRTLNVWNENNTNYMIDTSKKMYDTTSDPPNLDSTKGAIVIMDANHKELDAQGSITLSHVTSNNANAWSLRDAVSASFGLSKTYDYYLSQHQRNSLDGNGGTVFGVVRYAQGLQNAFWNGSFMAFGDAQPYAGAFDVVGHELTHGVTEKTAGLIYQNQSGALNEAISDIFGQSVENFSGVAKNWTMGEALGAPLRDMQNPSSLKILPDAAYTYPAKMSEFYVPESALLSRLKNGDNGGVHINSSIINHAFYYLAEGLTGAIGAKDAEKIFYRALTTHLLSNSQFVDARLACVQSAEEIFGADSTQATMTAKAFDAVEIIEDAGTPTDPNKRPPVNGTDASLFVYFNSGFYFLGRREGNDPKFGVQLSNIPISPKRPVVSGDGSRAVFVSADNDICGVATDGSEAAQCLGFSGSVYSIAMTPDANRWAFVLLNNLGFATNQMLIIDRKAQTQKIYNLVAPVNDGSGSYPIAYADSMDFSSDGRALVYDALTNVTQPGGSVNQLWSIYALDIDNEIYTSLLAPIEGVAIGNPVFAQTTDGVLAFEATNIFTGETAAFAANLVSGAVGVVGQSALCCTLPGFNGDDSAIVYGQFNNFTQPTGFSLIRQAVANDWVTVSGKSTIWLSDGYAGVIYRRGTYTVPEAKVAANPIELAFGNQKGFKSTVSFTNQGSARTALGDVSILPATAKFSIESDSCTGVSLEPTATCSVDVLFAGGSGLLGGTLNAPLPDDNKKLAVTLSGGIKLKVRTGKITFNVATPNKDQFSFSGQLTGAENVSLTAIKSISFVLGGFKQDITGFTKTGGLLKFHSDKAGVADLTINLVSGAFSLSGGKLDLSKLANTPQVGLRLNKTMDCSKPKFNTAQTQSWTFDSTKQTQTTCTKLFK